MNSFYVNLQAELADAKEELWAQTQIDGAETGKKTLLKGEPKNTDSVFTNESGERIFQERISRPAKLWSVGQGMYLCQSFAWERCLDSMLRW